ncbi:MAG: hypothetical protein WCV90_02950 [Candidatus Woesearchaeota archaeon]|jgi:hypothetical protein
MDKIYFGCTKEVEALVEGALIGSSIDYKRTHTYERKELCHIIEDMGDIICEGDEEHYRFLVKARDIFYGKSQDHLGRRLSVFTLTPPFGNFEDRRKSVVQALEQRLIDKIIVHGRGLK